MHTIMPFIKGRGMKGRYAAKHPLTVYGLSGHSSGQSWFWADAEKRGHNSPVAKWKREADSDDVVKMPLQPHIRSPQYHNIAALSHAVKLGMIKPGRVDFDAWIEVVLREVRRFRFRWRVYGQQAGVRFRQELFAKVLEEHRAILASPPAALRGCRICKTTGTPGISCRSGSSGRNSATMSQVRLRQAKACWVILHT